MPSMWFGWLADGEINLTLIAVAERREHFKMPEVGSANYGRLPGGDRF